MKFFLRLLGPAIFIFIIYYYVDFKEFKGIISILRWPYFSMSLVLVPFCQGILSAARWLWNQEIHANHYGRQIL
jgi:hypothetical protein